MNQDQQIVSHNHPLICSELENENNERPLVTRPDRCREFGTSFLGASLQWRLSQNSPAQHEPMFALRQESSRTAVVRNRPEGGTHPQGCREGISSTSSGCTMNRPDLCASSIPLLFAAQE